MIRVQVIDSILNVTKENWDSIGVPDFPFCGYHFLSALETTQCLNERTGWFPRFVLAWEDAQLVGAVVLYLKNNSYGEYIFDFAWADAYSRTGQAYYPKLTSAIPFTPATGPKLLLHPELSTPARAEVTRALLQEVDALAKQLKVSSLHALFVPPVSLPSYVENGYFLRHSFQFHWRNQNYRNFEDFLEKLRSKRRKEIRRERQQVAAAQVKIHRFTGAQLTGDLASLFYEFYISTIDKRNSYDYLTAEFFHHVFKNLKDQILLVLATDLSGKPVAGALNYFGSHTLYGRNWGCLADYKALHFELCYYQGIEFAIERGLQKFEAGAQGEHKFQRGFLPEITYSAHKVYEPRLNQAIQDHVQFEKSEIESLFQHYHEHSPFTQVPKAPV